ncbi:hypothetical protein GOQ25_03945 [Bordetella sp. 15P40C-2]|nr:hypothetical protein [Bordetella sp. 15P40C-2]
METRHEKKSVYGRNGRGRLGRLWCEHGANADDAHHRWRDTGGGTDTVARVLAAEIGNRLGETFLVENRPGAGGNIAAQEVARSANDGRTLLMCYTSHAINATLYPKLPFDSVKDFTPISHVANAPSFLLAHPSVNANNMTELIALAKTQPGALSIALPGIGSAGHLCAEVIKLQSGVDMLSVPYKGTAPAMNDLLGGQVNLLFAGAALAKGQLAAKSVKALGVSSAQRMVWPVRACRHEPHAHPATLASCSRDIG